MQKTIVLLFVSFLCSCSNTQDFYFGADMSYVNEMEDCDVVYHENRVAKDPYEIFKAHNGNLVRLRLWHTPTWYDDLNDGNRYSNFHDVKKAIARAKAQGLNVLLDFHLSDNWADPSKQLVPAAWLSVVDDTDILKDSLYNYIHQTLSNLHTENLLPEMIQIGNETNKGILLSPEDNAVWTLDWNRNAALFNHAIKAVRDFESTNNTEVQIMLHLADPANAEWLLDGFIENGVNDFDIIGMSYYWAWHQPTTIEETGETIEVLKSLYPDKSVIIVETGYIWTNDWNDNANNIITETHPDYRPASPTNQRDWLIDLTKEVKSAGGSGVVYWEPFWVSSDCFTQWGQGSHQEHATFFDFDNNLIQPGGIDWMSYNYGSPTSVETVVDESLPKVQILIDNRSGEIKIRQLQDKNYPLKYSITDATGRILQKGELDTKEKSISTSNSTDATYFISVFYNNEVVKAKSFSLIK